MYNSQTIFLQQLGRGLRTCEDKKYLNILDFIGNYRKADSFFLYKAYEGTNGSYNKHGHSEFNVPDDCLIDFDFELVDLLGKMGQRGKYKKDQVIKEFYEIRDDLGYTPSRIEFFMYLSEEGYQYVRKTKDLRPFSDYLSFLEEQGRIEGEERELLGTAAHEFITMIETTSMSKTYKMPVIQSFLTDDDTLRLKVTLDEIAQSMEEFYNIGSNKVDMYRTKNTKDFESWDKAKYIKLAKEMPLKYLIKSSGKFFKWDGEQFALSDKLSEFKNNKTFIKHIRDAMEFRVKEYYKNRNLN